MSRKSKALEFADDVYKIHVTGRNVLVTDAMKNYAIEKISKIERFSDRIIEVYVTMDIQKLDHRIDAVLKVGHIKVKSQGISSDMYVSVDQAVGKIKSQIRRYKDRINAHHAKGIQAVDMLVNVFNAPEDDELLSINDEIEEETNRRIAEQFRPHEIVSQKKRPLKVLSQEEAMMKMELSGDGFLIFRAEEDMRLKVIYRRKDRNFGIIEVES